MPNRWFTSTKTVGCAATQMPFAKLDEDILRVVFSSLTNEPYGDLLINQTSTDLDLAYTLSSAVSVSRSWYQPATEVLYKHVRLRDEHACVLFARTLRTQEHLARVVLSIQFPKRIFLLHVLAERPKRASKLLGYLYETKQFAISRAIEWIVAAAVNLQGLCGPFGDAPGGHSGVAIVRLGIASTLRSLRVNLGMIQWTTWTGAPDRREETKYFFLYLLLRPTALIWSNLQTLAIEGVDGIFYLGQFDAARFAEGFPVLRELVISRTSVSHMMLTQMLSALRNTLRTLSIWQTYLEQTPHLEPLVYVEISCEPGSQRREAFDNLEHLTCVGVTAYCRPVTSPINIGTLTRLKSLGVSSDIFGKIAVLPQQLTRLVIHVQDYSVARVTEEIENNLDNWIAGTPGLRQLVLSASGRSREIAYGWSAQCLRLRHRLEACSVQLSFETA